MPEKKILNPSSSGMDIPDAAIERIARVMLPMIQKYYESDEGKMELETWNETHKKKRRWKKMASERIEKLLAMQQKAEAQKRKAEQQLKAAKHKISIQRNKERTHRLCERGGHLEHYLPNPELLTDEDVFLLIDYFFSSPRVRELAEQMTASRRGEIPQSPKELIDAAMQRMPKPSVSSVTWHDTDEDDAESDGSSPIP